MTTPQLTELSTGDVVGETTVVFSRADLIRYAGASGDYNPIHWSEDTARQVGLPGVIAHGMLTMGAVVQVVSEWVGDPARIIDYQTRFTGMVPVADTTAESDPSQPFNEDTTPAGARLNVTAKIGKILQEQNQVRVDLTVTNPDQNDARVLTKAQVLVQL